MGTAKSSDLRSLEVTRQYSTVLAEIAADARAARDYSAILVSELGLSPDTGGAEG